MKNKGEGDDMDFSENFRLFMNMCCLYRSSAPAPVLFANRIIPLRSREDIPLLSYPII